MKFSNDVVKFFGNTDFVECFSDYYYNTDKMTAEQHNKIENAFFAEIEKKAGVAREGVTAEAWASHPSVQWAAFSVVDAVVNTILPQTLNSSIGLFTDLKFVGYGDSVKFRVRPRGLFVVSKGAFGERTTFRQKMFSGDVFVSPEEHIVTVFTDMLRVLMGKEDIAEFVRLVVISIETAMGKDAAQALSDGISAIGYPSALQVSGAFNAQDLIELGELVQAYNYGVKPVILGTAAALSRVVPDSSLGFRGNFDANGGSVQLIKDFYGFNLMVLPQYAAGATPNDGVALPSNKLFVVSPALDRLVKGNCRPAC